MHTINIEAHMNNLYEAVIQIYDIFIEQECKNFLVTIEDFTEDKLDKLYLFTDILNDLSNDLELQINIQLL